jgi:hypothetical protein
VTCAAIYEIITTSAANPVIAAAASDRIVSSSTINGDSLPYSGIYCDVVISGAAFND